jgi:hypothetical protein
LAVSGTVTANTGLSQPLTDTQLRATAVPVTNPAQNTTIALAESFQVFPGTAWTQSIALEDISDVDGNSIGSKYLVISKDPLSENTTTTVEAITRFRMPVELCIGVHMSQRTVGQEFGIKIVSTETPLSIPADVAILAIQQATTTLTVTTAVAHGLRIGARIGIYGVFDSRMNYSAVTVATVPTAVQFTVTAGQNGSIPSVTAGPFASGFVTVRPAMSGAPNGISQVFDGTTVTQASFYARAGGNDAMEDMIASGTFAGDHRVTVGTTASVQPVNALGTYSFQPTTEYRVVMFPEKQQWSDSAVDSIVEATSRSNRTQVVPDPHQTYKLLLSATNLRSFTRPVAQIISAVKATVTNVATVTTDVAHGLTTADIIVLCGARDTVNFGNVIAGTAIAAILSSTSFNVVWGTTAQFTTYGGYVARVNGGQLMQGALTQVANTISRASNVVTVVSLVSWTGVLVGDYVNLIGARDSTVSSLGVDGSYRVREINGTSLRLEPIGTAPTGADFVSATVGGAVIKRTDMRISYVRILPFERARFESVGRPVNDVSQAMPVAIKNVPAVTLNSGILTTCSTVTNVTTVATVTNVGAVGTVTACNLSAATIIDASGAITTTATTSNLSTNNNSMVTFGVSVTAVSGTIPTCDVVVQESMDNINWYDIYHFERITGVTGVISPPIRLQGQQIRYVRTITGTTPSFTMQLLRLVRHISGPTFRRIFDRAITPNTLNSTTAAMNCEGCDTVQLIQSSAAGASVAPVFTLEGSETGVSTEWYALGSTTVTGTASTTSSANYVGAIPKFLRARVSTVGTGAVINYLSLKARGT